MRGRQSMRITQIEAEPGPHPRLLTLGPGLSLFLQLASLSPSPPFTACPGSLCSSEALQCSWHVHFSQISPARKHGQGTVGHHDLGTFPDTALLGQTWENPKREGGTNFICLAVFPEVGAGGVIYGVGGVRRTPAPLLHLPTSQLERRRWTGQTAWVLALPLANCITSPTQPLCLSSLIANTG